MIASSAFVLTALTLTGVYLKSQNAESQDNGYTLDLAELENSTENEFQEIAENDISRAEDNTGFPQVADSTIGEEFGNQDNLTSDISNSDDAMDFMPLEAGSGLVEIPGLTDNLLESAGLGAKGAADEENAETDKLAEAEAEDAKLAAETETQEVATQEAATENVEVAKTLHFAESDGLLRPVSGEVLLPFSMDGSIYFSTLNHYKYNPALMLSAEEGTGVLACAEGNVIEIFEDAQIGTAVTMDLGNGYHLTYGQLKDVMVSVGDYVSEGEVFASVAAPTKYFSLEGSNLYLKLTADGTPVNPEVLFR